MYSDHDFLPFLLFLRLISTKLSARSHSYFEIYLKIRNFGYLQINHMSTKFEVISTINSLQKHFPGCLFTTIVELKV